MTPEGLEEFSSFRSAALYLMENFWCVLQLTLSTILEDYCSSPLIKALLSEVVGKRSEDSEK